MVTDTKEYLTVQELSAWLLDEMKIKSCPNTLYAQARQHQIPHQKLGKKYIFYKETIREWLKGVK